MWKSGLQVVVSLILLARLVVAAARIRRLFCGDGLALQFQRELRRRGLMAPLFRLPAS